MPFVMLAGDFVVAVWHVTHTSGGKPWGFNVILARRGADYYGAKFSKSADSIEGFEIKGPGDDAEAFAAVDERVDELVRVVEEIPDTTTIRKDVARVMAVVEPALVTRLQGLLGITAHGASARVRRRAKKGGAA